MACALLGACGPSAPAMPPDDGGTPPPARACRSGRDWSPGTPAFVDRSGAWGLSGENGSTLGTADLDGDGYPDLVVMRSSPYERVSGAVYLNREAPGGGRTFVDHTDASRLFQVRGGAPGETGRSASLLRFADLDGDGDVDAFTAPFFYLTEDGRAPLPDVAEILLNDGTGTFSLLPSPTVAIPENAMPTDGFFFDQDLDGVLDLAIGYWWEPPAWSSPYGDQPQLFRGTGGGGFVEVTDDVGMSLPRTSASVTSGTSRRPLFAFVMCDLNDDARMDIVGAAYARMANEVFLAEGDRFREIGASTAIGADDRIDYSDDQSFRCHCRSSPSTPGCEGLPPPIYACPVRGWYPGQSDQPWALGGNTFSYACADLDNDGDFDLYESNIRHPDVGSASDPSEVIVNEGAGPGGELRFVRPGREAMGLVPPVDLTRVDEGGQHDGAFDFDGDGRLDLYLAGSPYPGNAGWIFHQRADSGAGAALRFEWIGESAGFDHPCARGSAIADFDRDGDLDLVSGTYGCNDPANAPDYAPEEQPVRFWENVAAEHDWIAIRLVGRGAGGSNPQGIGARVSVTAGGATQTRLVRTSMADVSTEAELFFGLGASCDVERVEVRWPDRAGTVQAFEDVVANHVIEVREGEPAVRYR